MMIMAIKGCFVLIARDFTVVSANPQFRLNIAQFQMNMETIIYIQMHKQWNFIVIITTGMMRISAKIVRG